MSAVSEPGMVGARKSQYWKITLEFLAEHSSGSLSIGESFTLRMLERIDDISIYKGGTAGVKPSRPFFGMRGFFYILIKSFNVGRNGNH
jgi:hypothetical protein